MRRSTDRIIVSHAGTAPRPKDQSDLPSAVKEVVKRQADVGLDIVNDGELSKSNFTNYGKDRLGGITPAEQRATLPPRNNNARDLREFPDFFASGGGGFGRNRPSTGASAPSVFLQRMVVTGPITYVGQSTADSDVANMKAALHGLDVEGFLPAVAPVLSSTGSTTSTTPPTRSTSSPWRMRCTMSTRPSPTPD